MKTEASIITNVELRLIIAQQSEEIRALKDELCGLREAVARERAYDRQRLTKLETPKAGPKSKEQIDAVKRYLRDCPKCTAPFEAIRNHLRVGKARFSRLLSTDEAKAEFLILRGPNDKRKRMVKLRTKI